MKTMIIQFKNSLDFLANLMKQKAIALLLFTGDNDSKTKQSWCSDCRQIHYLFKTIQQQALNHKIPFYIVNVGQRTQWKNKNNIYRINKSIQIRSVPTLGLFQQNIMIKKLDQVLDIKNQKMRYLLFEDLKQKPNL